MRWYACGPEKSHDHDDDTSLGLLGEREGHCGCLLAPKCDGDALGAHGEATATSADSVSSPLQSWALVVGGYYEGELSGTPLAARVAFRTTTPAAQGAIRPLTWVELSYDEALEKDGASLTRWTASTALLFGGLDCDYERSDALHSVQLHITGTSDGDEEIDVSVSAPLHTTGDAPGARSRHGAGLSGDSLFIFGGDTNEAEQSADLYVLNAHTRVWRRVSHSAATTGGSPWPKARLLCTSLVFVSDEMFVLYGGARYVDGAIVSLSDGWLFDAHNWTFTRLWEDDSSSRTPVNAVPPDAYAHGIFPRCNGHGGVLWRGALTDGAGSGATAAVGAIFVGGKDASTGCDDVKLVQWPLDGPTSASTFSPADVRTALVPVEAENLETGLRTQAPHWRYTPVIIPCGTHGLLMVGGNCRHPRGAAAYYLSFS